MFLSLPVTIDMRFLDISFANVNFQPYHFLPQMLWLVLFKFSCDFASKTGDLSYGAMDLVRGFISLAKCMRNTKLRHTAPI